MIGTMGVSDFPLTREQATSALQVLAQQMHARYTSPFTLIALVPQGQWVTSELHEALLAHGAHPMMHHMIMRPIINEETNRVSYAPGVMPSTHAIMNRKVVIFGGQGDWLQLYTAAMILFELRPTSIEVGCFFSRATTPAWINPDYVGFQVPDNVIVSGLGLGYTALAMTGAEFIATEIGEGGTELAPADVSLPESLPVPPEG